EAAQARAIGDNETAILWDNVIKQSNATVSLYREAANHYRNRNTEKAELLNNIIPFTQAAVDSLAKVATYTSQARNPRVNQNNEATNFWEQLAHQLQDIVDRYFGLRLEYKNPRSKTAIHRAKSLKKDADDMQSAIDKRAKIAEAIANSIEVNNIKTEEYAAQAAKARDDGNEEIAILWDEAVNRSQVAVNKKINDYKDWCTNQDEKKKQNLENLSDFFVTISKLFANVAEYSTKAAKARIFKDEESALLWERANNIPKEAIKTADGFAKNEALPSGLVRHKFYIDIKLANDASQIAEERAAQNEKLTQLLNLLLSPLSGNE
ncbi:MAG: hypothetical protein ACH346_07680, partial [Chthoniobacterales bacterium]